MIRVEDIANKDFKKTLIGYDLEQVDRYLDEIIVLLKAMEEERREMLQTIDYLANELSFSGQKRVTDGRDTGVLPISPHDAEDAGD